MQLSFNEQDTSAVLRHLSPFDYLQGVITGNAPPTDPYVSDKLPGFETFSRGLIVLIPGSWSQLRQHAQ